MIVKICGMRNSDNIRDVAQLKPDWMGFIFYPKSKRYVGDNVNPELIKSLAPEIQTVGVFVNEEYEDLIDIARRCDFDFLQLHGNESPEYCRNAHEEGFEIIKAFGIHNEFDWNIIKDYTEVCKYFLFDTSTKEHGGSGKKFDWQVLNNYKLTKPFILSGGIGPEDTDNVNSINHPMYAGIDINSCFEIEPALKNTELIKTFLSKIKIK